MARRRTDEERRADEAFLEACLDEMDDGAAVTIVVPSARDARRMRSDLARGRSTRAVKVRRAAPPGERTP